MEAKHFCERSEGCAAIICMFFYMYESESLLPEVLFNRAVRAVETFILVNDNME